MSELMPILVLGTMVLIFVGTYVLNKKTPAPTLADGVDKAACKACNIVTCSNFGGDE